MSTNTIAVIGCILLSLLRSNSKTIHPRTMFLAIFPMAQSKPQRPASPTTTQRRVPAFPLESQEEPPTGKVAFAARIPVLCWVVCCQGTRCE